MGFVWTLVQDARRNTRIIAMDMMTEPTKPQKDAAEAIADTTGAIAANAEATETKGPEQKPGEIGGPKGPEPTRYGDWEFKGRCSDF